MHITYWPVLWIHILFSKFKQTNIGTMKHDLHMKMYLKTKFYIFFWIFVLFFLHRYKTTVVFRIFLKPSSFEKRGTKVAKSSLFCFGSIINKIVWASCMQQQYELFAREKTHLWWYSVAKSTVTNRKKHVYDGTLSQKVLFFPREKCQSFVANIKY